MTILLALITGSLLWPLCDALNDPRSNRSFVLRALLVVAFLVTAMIGLESHSVFWTTVPWGIFLFGYLTRDFEADEARSLRWRRERAFGRRHGHG